LELHFADKEVIVCKNPFQIIKKQAGKRIFQTEGLAINRDKEHQNSIQSEPGTANFRLGEKTVTLNKAGSNKSKCNTDV
ncbi:alpha-glucosidase, partial [Listeria monocytogenes]